MKVKAYYCDARDGRPESEIKARHGAVMPRDDLEVSVVDRAQRPAVIYGELPDGAEVDGKAVIEVSAEEHDSAVQKAVSRRTQARLQSLARVRYEREAAGVTIDGRTFHSDRDSRTNLAAARMKAKEGSPPKAYKLVDGEFWVQPEAEAFIAAVDEVFDYVDSCFEHEASLAEQILDGKRPDIDEGWPIRDRSTG